MENYINNEEKSAIIEDICKMLLIRDTNSAKEIIEDKYKFTIKPSSQRRI